MAVDGSAGNSATGRAGRFSHEVQRRVPAARRSACERDLKDLVLMMPQVLDRLDQLWKQHEVPSGLKRLSGYVRTYLCHPDDIIPERDGALFGYVDDAYLAAMVYLRGIDCLSYSNSLKGGREWEFVLKVRALHAAARFVIPAEAARLDAMVEGLLEGDDGAFQALFRRVP